MDDLYQYVNGELKNITQSNKIDYENIMNEIEDLKKEIKKDIT